MWKTIPKFPGYEASDFGEIRSWKNGAGKWLTKSPKRLTKTLGKDGYYRVCLCNNGKIFSRKVHVLVAAAFFGERPPRLQTNHKNGIQSDNRIDNLEYVTAAYNTRHAMALGLMKIDHICKNGSANHQSKLNETDVMEIVYLKNNGLKYSQLAKRFRVSSRTIKSVCIGERWSWLTGIHAHEKKMEEGK